MPYLDENDDENQFDVLGFLESGRKIIDDFHESKRFYVEEVDRGVYPRKLINMLIDMGLVDKFSPYKSSKKEIKEFEENLSKNDISEERLETLTQYTSFGLTEMGKDAYKVSKEREKETHQREKKLKVEKKAEAPEAAPPEEEKEEKKLEKKVTKEGKTKEVTEPEPQKKKPEQKEEPPKAKEEEKPIKASKPKKESAIEKVENIEKEIESLEEEIDSLGFFDRSEKKELEARKEKLVGLKSKLESKIQKVEKKCPKCASGGILYDGTHHYCPTCKFWWKK
ncbi:MAG: hypothetical protein R6U96_03430 [Promethearchaeia archaeon]